MSQLNPFASPQAVSDLDEPVELGGALTSRTFEILAKTRAWLILLAVLGYLGAALIVAVLVWAAGRGSLVFAGEMAIGLLVALSGTILMNVCAVRIGRFLRAGDMQSLAAALAAQKAIWMVYGIMAILAVLSILAVVASVVA